MWQQSLSDAADVPSLVPPLYGYQTESVERLRDGMRLRINGQVLSSATGSGKTVLAQHMIDAAVRKGSRAIFVVDRKSLLEQTSRRFHEVGIDHGTIAAGRSRGMHKQVIIAMVQSLAKRGWPDNLDIAFIDECHTQYAFLKETLPGVPFPFIGLTATPMVRGLGGTYGGLVQVTTTNRLIEDEKLVPLRIMEAVEIDMRNAPVSKGEWSAAEVEGRSRPIIGNIVSTWAEQTRKHFGHDLTKTMVFSASIAHGRELCERFQAAGHDFRQVSAHDSDEERDATMKAFRHGEFPGVVSVEALAKGIDLPDVECLVIARPYRKAFAAHIQMLGRGMRTSPGKEFCLVLDHSGNCGGFIAETSDFFEHGVSGLDDRRFRDVTRAERKPKDRSCAGCGFLMPPRATVCPSCGHVRKKRSEIDAVPGTMVEFDIGSQRARAGRSKNLMIWQACCERATFSYQHHQDAERAMKHARMLFNRLTDSWPPRAFKFVQVRPGQGDREIAKRIRKFDAEWKRRNARR